MPDDLLDANAIAQYLDEVTRELGSGTQRSIVMVGGAFLAWHGLRDATRDIDSVTRLDSEVAAAAGRVADTHDLAGDWLNDSAAAFRTATFDEAKCQVLLDHPRLLVLAAPFEEVFLMKLYASRAADTDDLEALWPHCHFTSPEAAVEAFYEAYPLEEHDPHLAEHLRAIL